MADENPVAATMPCENNSGVRVKIEEDTNGSTPTDIETSTSINDLPTDPLNEEEMRDNVDDPVAAIEEDMVAQLSNFLSNSTHHEPVHSTSYDEEYEDAVLAITQKKEEITIKETSGLSTATEQIQLKGLETDLRRIKKLKDKEQAGDARAREDAEMFVPEDDGNDSELELLAAPRRREATDEETSEYVSISDNDEDGTITTRQTSNKRGGKASKSTPKGRKSPTKASGTRVQKKGQPAGKSGRERRQGPSMLNMGSLLRNDIVQDAAANQGAGEQTSFKGIRTKKDALAALIASIPKDQRDTTRGEKTALDGATRQFCLHGQGTMQVKEDGWRHKGMATSLHHFQLLGAAWGCERETGTEAPFGGILADTMGYGKTVQMIAIMVENQPKPTAKNRTTLVVVPTSIVDQWIKELAAHTKPGTMDRILVHKSGSRVESPNVVAVLRQFDVVVTTYSEIMRNCPKCIPPLHLVTDKAKDEWWEKHYVANRGPLLSTPWYRVVLDEAQTIKNHESQTSKACRLLTAKYRWVLSGTPLSNCMEELYSYFHFLGVVGAGSFAQFRKNYAKRDDITTQRLDAILRTVMIRRTGADRLLGKPLVSLPALDHQTIEVEFSPIEKAIYSVVRQRFINRINDWSTAGRIGQMSRNIFVMLLRLRQMCAHVFMVNAVVNDLLETEDIEKLWGTIERHSQSNNESNQKTAKVLRRILKEARSEREASSASSISAPVSDFQGETIDLTLDDSNLDFRGFFYRLQQTGAWENVQNRSLCHLCKEIPEESAKISVPCGHLYCEECIQTLLRSAATVNVRATCSECQVTITGSADMRAMENLAAEIGDHNRATTPATRKKGKSKKNAELDTSWLNIPGTELMSTKVQAIVKTLEGWIAADPEAKIVIFTLFLPMIKVFAKICSHRGWGHREFTGAMSAISRNKSLKEWKDPDEDNKILLMSTRAGGIGLNLTEARYAVIVDPWWNEPLEDQAYSRIYRIGQKRDCAVRRVVIKDAIDTQLMLHLQKTKAEECDRIIDGRGQGQLDVRDLMRLFGPTRRDPETGAIIVEDEEGGHDGVDDFVIGEDHIVVDDSDTEEVSAAPSRPEET